MDEKLSGYINNQMNEPPVLDERRLVAELARRTKRMHLILLSLSSLLWAMLIYVVSLLVSMENQTAGIVLLAATSVGNVCAGCFAGIVIRFRKAGL